MEDLEQYIKENARRFDQEPAEGHFERFQQKLEDHRKSQRSILLQRSLRIASVALLLIVSGLYVNERYFADHESYVNPELKEAQYYYKTQISNGINTLEAIDGVMTEQQRALLIQEMSEADELLQELKDELKLAPDDPRVIEAMLQHYRLKANVVNKIVNELQQLQTDKKDLHHEINM